MRDFPLFTTDFGVASLILKEIPYKKEAYICIRDVQPGEFAAHLKECVAFCTMAGAERIYATGHEMLEGYPLYTSVIEMRGKPESDPHELMQLFPVTEQTVGRWREIYNQKMKNVDNAGTLERRDETRILKSSGAYFVHNQGMLLGIGWMEDNKLLAIASVVPGAGQRVAQALFSLCDMERITLEVASTNIRALRLYEKMGFIPVREISRWYRVS